MKKLIKANELVVVPPRSNHFFKDLLAEPTDVVLPDFGLPVISMRRKRVLDIRIFDKLI